MKAITSSPEIMGGTPVFAGTRVPVETLMDYLEALDSIHEFLDDFPTISQEQVVEVLGMVRISLVGVVGR